MNMTALIYDLIYIIPVTAAAEFCYAGLADTKIISPLVWAAVLLPSFYLTMLCHLSIKARLMLTGVTLAGIAGIIIVFRQLADHIALSDKAYLLPFLLISVLSYAAGILMTRFTSARIAGALICLLLPVLALFSLIHLHKAGIFSAMFVIIISTADRIQHRWKKEGFTDRKTHMVYTAPFLVIIIAASSFIRYPAEPYDWHFVIALRDGIVSAADRISYIFGTTNDVITGFSDDGYLLTGLHSTGKAVLTLTARTDTGSPVYLYGNVSDSFDGHGWKHTDDSPIPERTFDVLESISSVKSYSDLLTDYYRESDISVEYTDLKTRYLLAPSKLTSDFSSSGKASATQNGGNYTFRRCNPYHLKLNESYLLANKDNPAFTDYMQSNAHPDEKNWKEALNVIKEDNAGGVLSYDKYHAYKEHILKYYTEDVPLSPALKEKLDLLYSGSVSKFEKMKRLEAAMNHMKYTLDPPPVPDEINSSSGFLDYFILEGDGGYCSYYATAFALLARSEGLPSRYVQGYRINADRKGTYTVTSDMAHAWPEVYFEGKGWIIFEPTPGFYSESIWATKNEASSATPDSLPVQPVFAPTSAVPVSTSVSRDMAAGRHVRAAVFLVPLSLIALFFILFIIIGRIVRRRIISGLDDMSKLKFLARDSLSILHLLRLGIREDETLSEYKQRLLPETGEAPLSFISGYEELLYSGKGTICMTPEEFQDCRTRLLSLLRKKNRFRYILRIIL